MVNQPGPTMLRLTVATLVIAGQISATCESRGAGGFAPPVFACHLPPPDSRAVFRTVRGFLRQGLVHLSFREDVGSFRHYRVEPTREGAGVFGAWGLPCKVD